MRGKFSFFHTVEIVQNPLYQNDLIMLQVQSAALAAMKDEMLELASRLTRVTKERDYMEKALNRLQVSIPQCEKTRTLLSLEKYFVKTSYTII